MARSDDEPASETSRVLEEILLGQLRSRAGRGLAPGSTVVFDTGNTGVWTLTVHGDERLTLARGRVRRPTTRVMTDAATLAAVVRGECSGAEAFLDGRLTLRGRIGLGTQLDGAFEGERPDTHPISRRALALGVDTSYLEAGPRGATPVVILHGLGATNASLMTTIVDLARDHHVIAPDLPGFGLSAAPRWRYTPEDFALWLRAFMRQVGMPRAWLIGNSLGGRIVMEAGLQHPETVEGMVLYCPSAAFRRMRQMVPAVRLVPPYVGQVLPFPAGHRAVVRGIRTMFHNPNRLPMGWYHAAADEFLGVMDSGLHRRAFLSALQQIYLEDAFGERGFWDRLPALTPPALYVWGRQDILVPVRFARHVEQSLPRARSVVVEHCGHVPQFEWPELTSQLTREFLGSGRVIERVGLEEGYPDSEPEIDVAARIAASDPEMAPLDLDLRPGDDSDAMGSDEPPGRLSP